MSGVTRTSMSARPNCDERARICVLAQPQVVCDAGGSMGSSTVAIGMRGIEHTGQK
jgi:hypothetical protein